jgi:hypothetical protein
MSETLLPPPPEKAPAVSLAVQAALSADSCSQADQEPTAAPMLTMKMARRLFCMSMPSELARALLREIGATPLARAMRCVSCSVYMG